jgi:CheY-like chemotaxis protein
MEGRPQGTETILIVDDDELVRISAATLMASLGYRVLSAGSGSDALEACARTARSIFCSPTSSCPAECMARNSWPRRAGCGRN